MCRYETEQFQRDIKNLGISLSEKQIGQFIRYYEMLVKWNERMNLTAITEYEDVMKKHFVDSLSLVKAYDMKNASNLIDVGTGAGFPGLALKIAFPGCRVTLLDSLNKRIRFLDTVIEEMGLTDVEAVHGRAEDFARPGKLRESFDLCVSRAVANLSTLSEYCLPFVKKDLEWQWRAGRLYTYLQWLYGWPLESGTGLPGILWPGGSQTVLLYLFRRN